MEFELMDESMMEYAIQLSIDLDKRFGINRKYRTVSQRDVPGWNMNYVKRTFLYYFFSCLHTADIFPRSFGV